jgi:hypothetical protein
MLGKTTKGEPIASRCFAGMNILFFESTLCRYVPVIGISGIIAPLLSKFFCPLRWENLAFSLSENENSVTYAPPRATFHLIGVFIIKQS